MSTAFIASCSLLAFGPVAGLLIFVVGRRSHLAVIALATAFAWLVVALISSVLWQATPFLHWQWITLLSGVLVQGASRQLVVEGCMRLEQLVATGAHSARAVAVLPLNDTAVSLGKPLTVSARLIESHNGVQHSNDTALVPVACMLVA
jgi:Aph-1 protein